MYNGTTYVSCLPAVCQAWTHSTNSSVTVLPPSTPVRPLQDGCQLLSAHENGWWHWQNVRPEARNEDRDASARSEAPTRERQSNKTEYFL